MNLYKIESTNDHIHYINLEAVVNVVKLDDYYVVSLLGTDNYFDVSKKSGEALIRQLQSISN